MPNHLAWTLGHLALTAYRCTERVNRQDEPGELPPSAFVMGDRGDRQRFATEGVAFGSSPTDDPDRYPTLERSLVIMREAHRTLADSLRSADEDAIARKTPWGTGETTVSDLALRMSLGTAGGGASPAGLRGLICASVYTSSPPSPRAYALMSMIRSLESCFIWSAASYHSWVAFLAAWRAAPAAVSFSRAVVANSVMAATCAAVRSMAAWLVVQGSMCCSTQSSACARSEGMLLADRAAAARGTTDAPEGLLFWIGLAAFVFAGVLGVVRLLSGKRLS